MGQEVVVRDAGGKEPLPEPRTSDVAFLAASLHVGRYQTALVEFARAHHETLNAMASDFISVSLSAAGENPDDWEGLEQCVARLFNETRWKPKPIHHAAGAIRYSQYDFFKRLALKFIAARRGQHTVTSRDYDLTDYDALTAFVMDFVRREAA
jgi:menaquinone-dependent protoporphyrinogen oxidase